MNVLFVDDEPEILEGLRRALRKETYTIHTAISPTLAIEILQKQPIDVIVSDERMPGCTGTEFLSKISRMFPATIRIMLTGEAGLDGAVRAINDGKLYRFLNKPIDTTELASTIRNALNMRRLGELRSRMPSSP